MKTNFFGVIFALALILTLTSARVLGQESVDNKQGHGQGNIPGMTDEQKTKMKEIRTASMKEILPLKNELREKEAHLQTISTGNNVDLNLINKTIDEIGLLKTTIAKKHAATRYSIRLILNDEQKVYFDSHFAKKKHKMQE